MIKILQEKAVSGNKCCNCRYKTIPCTILTCALTGKRIRHYQLACENFEKNDF